MEMPSGRARTSYLIATAAAAALSLAVSAAPASAAITSHTVTGLVAPSATTKTTFSASSLRLDADVTYNPLTPPPANPTPKVTQTVFHLDDDVVVDVSAIPECVRANIENTTTAAAIAACPNSVIGDGAVTISGGATFQGVITVFRGEDDLSDNPVLLYHVRTAPPDPNPPTTSILEGVIDDSTNGADFGQQITITGGGTPAGIAVTHTHATLNNTVVTARCNDGDTVWNYAANWTYDSGPPGSNTATQSCSLAQRTLNVNVNGLGSVTSGAEINCPGDCTEDYDDEDVVALTANTSGGSTFTGWSGACSGSGACNVTMDGAKSVTANFAGGAGSISGNVTADDGGADLEGICVSAQPSTPGPGFGFTQTNASGDYTITGLAAGSYRVQFTDCPTAPTDGEYAPEFYNDKRNFQEANTVAVTPGNTASGIDAALADGATISGNVTADNGGADLAGICVSAQGGGFGGSAQTNASGDYTIRGLAAGSYRVQFTDCPTFPGEQAEYSSEHYNDEASFFDADLVAVAAGQDVTGINAALADGATISGSVTAENGGADLEGICVNASSTSGGSFGFTQTDANGDYTIGGLAADDYRVHFSDCGPPPADYAPELYDDATFNDPDLVAVTAGGAVTGIDAALADGATISGNVTADIGGADLEGICVSATSTTAGAGFAGFAQTNASGDYTITGLAAGSYRVQFSDCGPAPTEYAFEYHDNATSVGDADPVTLLVGEDETGVDAALALGGSISGTVVAETGGAPLSGICVSASSTTGGEGFVGFSLTDSNGDYTITGLAAGSYRVQFTDCSFEPEYVPEFYDDRVNEDAATPVTVSGTGTTTLDDAELATGEIEQFEDVPAGATVTANETPSSGDPVGAALTTSGAGQTGDVTISEVPSGAAPSGYSLVGENVFIDAPPGTVEAPLEIAFKIHQSALPAGIDHTNLAVFRNGTLVPACTHAEDAVPDPCVSARVPADGNGNIGITVRTSQASLWNFGVQQPGTNTGGQQGNTGTGESADCEPLRQKIKKLSKKIKKEEDSDQKAKLRKKRKTARNQLAALGCSP